MHQPYWSGPTTEPERTTATKPWIHGLYDAGADLLLGAPDHGYARFAPQTPDGVIDTARGMPSLVVATGGFTQLRRGRHDDVAASPVKPCRRRVTGWPA